MSLRLDAFSFRDGENVEYKFRCLGCGFVHHVRTAGNAPVWEWNGDTERPTVSPSILVRTRDTVCHSFIENGQIRYLDDCTHALAGKTIELPDCPQTFVYEEDA
jgi:Family of unknown function (DUF6527)